MIFFIRIKILFPVVLQDISKLYIHDFLQFQSNQFCFFFRVWSAGIYWDTSQFVERVSIFIYVREGRGGQCSVNYTGTLSFMITRSYSLAKKLWVRDNFDNHHWGMEMHINLSCTVLSFKDT